MPRTAAKTNHYVKQRARRIVQDTWEAQANLSFFLGMLVLFTFVFPLSSLVEQHMNVYIDIAYSLLLVSGIAISWGRPILFYLGVSAGLAGLLTRWGVRLYPPLINVREFFSLVALLLMVVILLVRVFERGPVSGSRVQGAIAAYLLLGLGWAHAYAIVSRMHPQAFTSSGQQPLTPAGWTYFSFVTLTTVGYGDIVPNAPVARMLAMGEALTGQLYLAVLVARLVALQVSNGSQANNNHE